MSKVDYLIVGQGIAGTLLSYFLLKEGKTIKVIDSHSDNIPSIAAGAIINPVTGRKTVKSWKIDELLPIAKATYRELEQLLDIDILTEKPIHKYFGNPADKADFDDDKIGTMDGHASLLQKIDNGIKQELGGIEIHTSCWVNGRALLPAWKNHLLGKGLVNNENFDHAALKILADDSIAYKGTKATKIIFCEGSRMLDNPWFNYLPMNAAKGEALIIEMPTLSQEYIILKGFFLLPIGNGQFYVGSTNEWDSENAEPTAKKREELEVGISKITDLPYQVIKQFSGLRPNVKNRRPLIGLHPKKSSIAVFNGMGTKGFSLSPWCAMMFIDYLERNIPLDEETDIARFQL